MIFPVCISMVKIATGGSLKTVSVTVFIISKQIHRSQQNNNAWKIVQTVTALIQKTDKKLFISWHSTFTGHLISVYLWIKLLHSSPQFQLQNFAVCVNPTHRMFTVCKISHFISRSTLHVYYSLLVLLSIHRIFTVVKSEVFYNTF